MLWFCYQMVSYWLFFVLVVGSYEMLLSPRINMRMDGWLVVPGGRSLHCWQRGSSFFWSFYRFSSEFLYVTLRPNETQNPLPTNPPSKSHSPVGGTLVLLSSFPTTNPHPSIHPSFVNLISIVLILWRHHSEMRLQISFRVAQKNSCGQILAVVVVVKWTRYR